MTSNHDSYRRVIDELRLEILADQSLGFDRANIMVVKINGQILNYLSSVRTFLDHAETELERNFGKNSTQFEEFKTATSREFDGCFSYRFLSQLRNFTQHCGLPLGELKLNVSDVPSGESSKSCIVECLFARDYLLENFNNWKKVRTELAGMPKKFPVDPHLEEMSASVERIEKTLVGIQSNGVLEHLEFLESLAKEVDHLPGSPCVYTSILSAQKGITANLTRIHLDLLGFVRKALDGLSEN